MDPFRREAKSQGSQFTAELPRCGAAVAAGGLVIAPGIEDGISRDSPDEQNNLDKKRQKPPVT